MEGALTASGEGSGRQNGDAWQNEFPLVGKARWKESVSHVQGCWLEGLEGLITLSTSRAALFPPILQAGDMEGPWPAPCTLFSPHFSLVQKRGAVKLYPPRLLGVPSPGQTAESSPGSGFSRCRLCSRETPPARRALCGTWPSCLGPGTCRPEGEEA